MIKPIVKFISVLSTVLIILGFLIFIFMKEDKFPAPENTHTETFIVVRVIDGDTFELSNGQRVRMLGIDTPEKYDSKKLERDVEITKQDRKTIKRLGELASEYVKNFLEGKRVILKKEPYGDDKDKYGRLLRWVYLEDGTFVNGKIVADGYANVYEEFPVSKTLELRQLEREARENKRGLWGEIKGLQQFK
ncbi:MAG: thermonuclease family protein [Ignavibacteria bacterium]